MRALPGIWLALAAAAAAACGDDGIEVSGELGMPVPATITASVPTVEVVAGTLGGGAFLVDSGAPLSLLDTSYFQLPSREFRLDLDAFAVTFPERRVAAVALFGDGSPFAGLIGGDILRHFAVSVDYGGSTAWLEQAADGLPAGFAADRADPPVSTPVTVAGGGVFVLPDCDSCSAVEVGATRMLVEVDIESGTPALLLVDTGATSLLIEPTLLASLGGADRPRLDGVRVATAAGDTTAAYVRIGRLAVGGAEQVSVPALVLPDDSFLDGLEAEVGRPVDGLLGGSFLRGFLATLDYPGAVLRLARLRDRDHIDPDEFIGVGFTMVASGPVWEVLDVYPGTDAAADGLVAGDEIRELDGESIAGASRPTVDAILARFGLGDEVPVVARRGADLYNLSIAVEDLLPAYQTP